MQNERSHNVWINFDKRNLVKSLESILLILLNQATFAPQVNIL